MNNDQLNTVLAALRLYQSCGYGNSGLRPDWVQEIAAPTINDTSLDSDGIDALCEQLNTPVRQW
jgi:hypothetical protein